MSDFEQGRAERMARYKEQRRRQLATQFGASAEAASSRVHHPPSTRHSSSSEEPRTTRTSRLRAAVSSPSSASSTKTRTDVEKSLPSISNGVGRTRRIERDKSNKRKSNLNRARNCEEAPSPDSSDDLVGRRRRRPACSQETTPLRSGETSANEENIPVALVSSSTSSASTASSTPKSARKSSLRMHMENARKGVLPSYSEMGKANNRNSPRRTPVRSSVNKSRSNSPNKENIDADPLAIRQRSNQVSKRMEELTALTRETLARVERLAKQSRDSPTPTTPPFRSKTVRAQESRSETSFLHKKKLDTSSREPSVPSSTTAHFTPISNPVSILKRTIALDECRASTSSTPPVTFSPSVVDPTPTRKKQGILKKRRSLDEAQVLRHRSCSPGQDSDDKPAGSILKSQRRSSLEELAHSEYATEPYPHSILKRRTSRHEVDTDPACNTPEPHSILKRRSGTSSASSSSSSPHVSIATAVILAAAGGAEMILDPCGEHVKPILKKKSFSEENSSGDYPAGVEVPPRPILKKKSSTDTDECEERPKKPILKNAKLIDDTDVNRSILRGTSRESSPRPRLSFSDQSEATAVRRAEIGGGILRQQRAARRATLESYFHVEPPKSQAANDTAQQQEPVSVFEMVRKFEISMPSMGAIPKRNNQNRNRDRYRTQPVTYEELEASRYCITSNFRPDLPSSPFVPYSTTEPVSTPSAHSLVDLSEPYNESPLTGVLSISLPNSGFHRGICTRMSSDSAFQSLGDGLELEQEEKPIAPKPVLPKASPMALQMKALAQEAKNLQLKRSGSNVSRIRSRRDLDDASSRSSTRFATQPVTLGEVQEAAKLQPGDDAANELDPNDPCNMSLSERIKFFSSTAAAPVARKRTARFQTQPVTFEEVENALSACWKPHLPDIGEKRGILKPRTSPIPRESPKLPPHHRRPTLKKQNESPESVGSPRGLRSILKAEATDFSRDEGISSDKSESESELDDGKVDATSEEKENQCAKVFGGEVNSRVFSGTSSETQTSDGDSSGGREVRAIIGRESNRRRLREKPSNENQLSRSRSQGGLKNEEVTHLGVQRSLTNAAMPKTIAELQAKLQRSGDSEWRKRIPKLNSANEELSLLNVKNIINDEISEKSPSILSARKDELDMAAKQWKSRVEISDADTFSVAGKLKQSKEIVSIPINLPPTEARKAPKAKKFKGKEDESKEVVSQPVSPEKIPSNFKRSVSLPGAGDTDSSAGPEDVKISSRKVEVSRPDDVTFQSFFKNLSPTETKSSLQISSDDLDSVVREADNLLLQQRRVKVQRTREGSRNPIKALAARKDIKDEYTEIITGVAERERLRLNVEKLSKSSHFAVEALAGLASKEDFTSVALKRSSSLNLPFLPYTELMLLQIKGRRHVQTRLIEPIAANINEGDCFILITPARVFNYMGAYANVIEKSKANDVASHILRTGDMGCKTEKIITINSKQIGGATTSAEEEFWKLLGGTNETRVIPSGHPDEDEVYESSILDTNMIYEFRNDELVPVESVWGGLPKIEMLALTRILIFDFGSEMYVWSGKNAPLDQKKKALKLARELWNEGFNYTECSLCPINVASMLGSRPQRTLPRNGHRPPWSLFAKITQHRETILFKEKFLNWPDYGRIIRIKRNDDAHDDDVHVKFDFSACDVRQMLKQGQIEPDLQIDQLHLGRGQSYYDEDTCRLLNFATKSVTTWVILEYTHERLPAESRGHFHDANSYIVRWEFCATVTGRELSGKPSKHIQAGRDYCVYFCWQGDEATVNEKGAAALLTIELDCENARQIRIVQGYEPPAFLHLFDGAMVIHCGKRDKRNDSDDFRLYIVRGECDAETVLTEVPCSMRHLRGRASFLLVSAQASEVTVWHGAQSSRRTREMAMRVAEHVAQRRSREFGFAGDPVTVRHVEEMAEDRGFLAALGGEKRQLYMSLASKNNLESTPRLFHLSSISGVFAHTELLCAHRSDFITPYPFLQCDLYAASQPALFLLDNGGEVWLWQGWWPEQENDVELVDQTGSGAVRWQTERRAAMQTAVEYVRERGGVAAYVVWAGLEPLAFTNQFPFWKDRDDVALLNIHEGRIAGEMTPVEEELALLTRSAYPLEQLLQRPPPEGVDPTHLEDYLTNEDFETLMSMPLEEFKKLPVWKQTKLKKEKGLF